jgi:HPt (histidine-containing phosphotransfer) domain-containing protein
MRKHLSNNRVHRLLKTGALLQLGLISHKETSRRFELLLDGLLVLTASEYGFIDEKRRCGKHIPDLKAYVITNIEWDTATLGHYETFNDYGLEFYNLNTFFSQVYSAHKPLTSTTPDTRSAHASLPLDDISLKALHNLPGKFRGIFVAMTGMSGSVVGYDQTLITDIESPIYAVSHIIVAQRVCKARTSAGKQTGIAELLNLSDVETVHNSVITSNKRPRPDIFNWVLNRNIVNLTKNEAISNHAHQATETARRDQSYLSIEHHPQTLCEARHSVNSIVLDLARIEPSLQGIGKDTLSISAFYAGVTQLPPVRYEESSLKGSRKALFDQRLDACLSKPVDRPQLNSAARHLPNEANHTILASREFLKQVEISRPNADPEDPLVSAEVLSDLANDTSADLVPKIVRLFISELHTRAQRMSDAIETCDIKVIASEAHALKSSAASYGAQVVARHARGVDQACKDGDLVLAIEQARKLIAIVEPTEAAFLLQPIVRR